MRIRSILLRGVDVLEEEEEEAYRGVCWEAFGRGGGRWREVRRRGGRGRRRRWRRDIVAWLCGLWMDFYLPIVAGEGEMSGRVEYCVGREVYKLREGKKA